MAGEEVTVLDVIRLKREVVVKRSAPVRRSPPVHKLVVRLLPGISEHLRAEMRYRGDLSAMVIEAINPGDLDVARRSKRRSVFKFHLHLQSAELLRSTCPIAGRPTPGIIDIRSSDDRFTTCRTDRICRKGL